MPSVVPDVPANTDALKLDCGGGDELMRFLALTVWQPPQLGVQASSRS